MRCPFHDDQHPSAGFQPETKVFHCFTCNRTVGLPELAQALLMYPPNPSGGEAGSLKTSAAKSGESTLSLSRPVGLTQPSGPPSLTVLSGSSPSPLAEQVVAEYRYLFPDGTPSHLVRRLEQPNGKKRFSQCHPDGAPGLPENYWPLYEPQAIAPDSYLYLVEGEKSVHAILDASSVMTLPADRPLRAMSWNGGAQSAQKHATVLARRIKELDPAWVVCWPDNDEPGMSAMAVIVRALRKEAIPCGLIDPTVLNLPPKGDAVDYLAAGGSIIDLFLKHRGQDDQVLAFVNNLPVLPNQFFVFPATRHPCKVEEGEIDSAWQVVHRQLPSVRQRRDARARLLARSIQSPLRPYYRFASLPDHFVWRPSETGHAFQVSAAGVGVAPDPPGSFILLPNAQPHYPTGYDPSGTVEDFSALIDLFALDPAVRDLLEGWLCCTLLGYQAPILLIKGPAGSGKSTLAKALLGIIEPTVPELDAASDFTKERREMVRALESNNAILVDNVSALNRSMEDQLAKLVTDTTHVLRPMYEDYAAMIRMHRSIVITTVSWDIYKSDLASRTVAIKTVARTQWDGEEEMREKVKSMIDRWRGYIWSRCVEVYRQPLRRTQARDFRVGDLSLVFDRLGVDVRQVAAQMRQQRADLLSTNDARLEAIVAYWKEGMSKTVLPKALARYIMDQDGENELPVHVLGRYLNEKAEAFKDFGFQIDTTGRMASGKVYRFLPVEETAEAAVAKEEPDNAEPGS